MNAINNNTNLAPNTLTFLPIRNFKFKKYIFKGLIYFFLVLKYENSFKILI